MEFKTMWLLLAVPAFPHKEALAFQLRTHVRGVAERMIEGVPIVGPGAFDAMWEKLTAHYDDVAAAVEAAMGDLKKLRPVKEEDFRGLIAVVDAVESA